MRSWTGMCWMTGIPMSTRQRPLRFSMRWQSGGKTMTMWSMRSAMSPTPGPHGMGSKAMPMRWSLWSVNTTATRWLLWARLPGARILTRLLLLLWNMTIFYTPSTSMPIPTPTGSANGWNPALPRVFRCLSVSLAPAMPPVMAGITLTRPPSGWIC